MWAWACVEDWEKYTAPETNWCGLAPVITMCNFPSILECGCRVALAFVALKLSPEPARCSLLPHTKLTATILRSQPRDMSAAVARLYPAGELRIRALGWQGREGEEQPFQKAICRLRCLPGIAIAMRLSCLPAKYSILACQCGSACSHA